jgi:hypothetical protein
MVRTQDWVIDDPGMNWSSQVVCEALECVPNAPLASDADGAIYSQMAELPGFSAILPMRYTVGPPSSQRRNASLPSMSSNPDSSWPIVACGQWNQTVNALRDARMSWSSAAEPLPTLTQLREP